ncbi:MAG: hypothetical protein JWO12_3282, partial [Frankiales bacterium]|nr:hypothetical protein [Frankiales bacterium]
MSRRVRSRTGRVLTLAATLVAGGLVVQANQPAEAGVTRLVSKVTASDGQVISVTNHLTPTARAVLKDNSQGKRTKKEYLLVWAGDANAADTTGKTIQETRLAVNPVHLVNEDTDNAPGSDFLAVIDATKGSSTYGKVVNTATVGPIVENEPHHMQYIYNKGDKVFAGGLFSDTTYVFDVAKLPALSLSGANLPQDTLCGSIPDAYWVLKDHTAYGTYMGGPDAPGPCTYSNGQTRVGNGFGGSPGEVVHIGADGKTLSESPSALPVGEDPVDCINYPVLANATCANPHGIQVREDLRTLIASDYAEPRNIVLDPVKPPDSNLFRDTVRTYSIQDKNNPVLKSVSHMPDGPRVERNPG